VLREVGNRGVRRSAFTSPVKAPGGFQIGRMDVSESIIQLAAMFLIPLLLLSHMPGDDVVSQFLAGVVRLRDRIARVSLPENVWTFSGLTRVHPEMP